VLCVDHGEKRLGLALSDPSASLAAPLTVIEHVSRQLDAAQVAELARQHEAGLIVVGQSFDEQGNPNPAGRRAARFAAALESQTAIAVTLWDESMSTQDARLARLELGASRKHRSGHLDAFAAQVILQSYLDAHHESEG
jgi:putative Holliday junction resolvase